MWRSAIVTRNRKVLAVNPTDLNLLWGWRGRNSRGLLSRAYASIAPPSASTACDLQFETTVAARSSLVSAIGRYSLCYWQLSKARLSMLVVATSGTGFILGSSASWAAIDFPGLCWTCAGTMMVAASAGSLNQVIEVANDSKMKRTSKRPLPSGRISVPHAIAWASVVGLSGSTILALKANMLTCGLAASNLFLYAFVYTPLKQIHPINTWVGAIVGAIPPLLGWTAACGEISLNSLILPAALYFWQIPHFMALAYFCRQDYADGGFKMLSLHDATGRRTALAAMRNCVYLLPLGYVACKWGLTSDWFMMESSVLTLAITAAAYSFYRQRSKNSAKRMFFASLLYLPVFMSGLLVHRRIGVREEAAPEEQESPVDDRVLSEKRRVYARPPVAYASAAPFPFLPAPSYAAC